MHFNITNNPTPNSRGVREQRNVVNQLKKNNTYSLTENNERRIAHAIEELGKHSGESNTRFLLDTAKELKYTTSINLNKRAKVDWEKKLNQAAESSYENSDLATKEKLAKSMDKMYATKPLSATEKNILATRESIISKLDMTQLEDEKNPNIKNVQRNLDYFIASSETSIEQKAEVLGKLDFMLSPEYKINPQLENKKTKVVAEIINDIVIDTPESEVPNTKAINQRHHGMCAAISISRKLMSYEDKSKYVDILMSELDATPHIMIFDKTNIGKNKRIPVEKTYVDFDEAQNKGYRIIDASTTQWMNIADMYGASNKNKYFYTAFDSANFDAMTDKHQMALIPDDRYKIKHANYQALLNSQESIASAKRMEERQKLGKKNSVDTKAKDIEYLAKLNNAMVAELKTIIPNQSTKELKEFSQDLLQLRANSSSNKSKKENDIKKFVYIPNEEPHIKNKKVADYIKTKYPSANSEEVDKKAGSIRGFIDESISLTKELQPRHSQASGLSKARMLYEAAAKYTYQKRTALKDNDYLIDKMVQYNVPDQETIISESLDRISKNPKSETAKIFKTRINGNDESVVQIKDAFNHYKTTGLDYIYGALGLGNRKQVLQNEIESKMEQVSKNIFPENETTKLAHSLGVKNDRKQILKALNSHQEKLANPKSTEQDYTNAFNKLGHKCQIEYSTNIFMQAAEKLQANDESAILYRQYFNAINGLPENATMEHTVNRLNEIGDSINSINDFTTNLANVLQIETEGNKVLHSVDPKHLVEKAMLRDGELYSNNELQPLKDRFDRIDRIRSQDEFSSRQGTINDKSLYKLSDNEERTVNKIRKNLNKMASETNKEIESVFKEIKEPLEEHVRKIGVATGSYWNRQLKGGLSSPQELKILENLTDRNYKISENIPKAVEKIKNSPYSGISSSSVFHDRIGMHAQYIEEVTPSPKNGKDILYHDNTWGASELENTWVDSEGLIRTDYSDRRGGELGYVTNKKYLNGNYVDNIVYKTGQTSDGEKFELMSDIILPGVDKKAKSIAAVIRERIFRPANSEIDAFDKILSKMTTKEIEAGIKRNELAASGYRGKIKNLNEKVFGNAGKKGIDTQEEYNNLPKNDVVKLTFEKAALSSSFPQGVDQRDVALAESLEKIENLKAKMNKIARSYFDYAFGKEDAIKQAYLNNDKNNHSNQIVKSALEKNNINVEDEKLQKIVANSILKKDDKFDGSMKNTINNILDNVSTNLETELGKSENLDKAKQEINKNLRTDLENALYINIEDVNNESTKFSGIKRFIDRKYNPETNEEFVAQYRKMQDMTKEEFNNATKDVLPTELGIAETSGYEILKRYKASNGIAENQIRNMVYLKELYNDIELPKTKTTYKYNKLYKQDQGAVYTSERTFDDLYRSMTFNLQNLEFESMFNAVKGSARKQYNALPAYPKIEVLSPNALKQERDLFDSNILSSIEAIETNRSILRGYRLTDKLVGRIEKLDDNKKPSSKEIDKIKTFAEEFIIENEGDTTISKSLESAQAIIDLPADAKGVEYKNNISNLKTEFDGYKRLNPPEQIQQNISNNIKAIKEIGKYFITGDIQPKKIPVVAEAFNNYMNKAITSNSHYIDSKIDTMSNRLDEYSLGKKGFKTAKNNYMDTLETDLYNLTTLNEQLAASQAQEEANIPKGFIDAVNKLRTKTLAKISKDSEVFINGNVKKEYRNSVSANVKDLIKLANKPSATSEKTIQDLELAREEFWGAISKHHIMREPQELLKSYMKSMAKDAKPASESMEKLMEHKKNIQKQYLEGASSTASLVDLQDTLMTIDNGANPGLVVEKLFAYDSGLVNTQTKQPLQMSDPISIDYMVKQMIQGENDETAIMFINKLGFAKKYIDAQNTIINFDGANKIVDGIVNIVGKTQVQQNIINDALKPLLTPEAETSKTFLKDLDAAKKQIQEKSKNLSDKKHIKTYLASINQVKKIIKQNPEIPKTTVLKQALEYSNKHTQQVLTEEINFLQENLNVVHQTHTFINKLDIPEYSEAIKSREKFNEKYNKFVEYNNKSLINLSNSNNSVSCKIQDV